MAMISSAEIQASVSTSSGSPTILVMIENLRGRPTAAKSLSRPIETAMTRFT
jgi:hypothetical protein